MRHFISYDADGILQGEETYTGGFPSECDLRDASSLNPLVQNIRRSRIGRSNFSNWILYICPCPSTALACNCSPNRVKDSYVKDGLLTSKPVISMMVDGTITPPTTSSNPISRQPGTSIQFRLQGIVPDGYEIMLNRSGLVIILQTPTPLVFTNGQTQAVTLVAPAQGMVGWVYSSGKLVTHFALHVMGWS